MRSFCRKNPVHKIPHFRGGYFGFGGGGKCRFIFMGARIFLKNCKSWKNESRIAGLESPKPGNGLTIPVGFLSRVTGNWVHANGGIINGGVACICAKWRVFVHFCAFLRFFVRFCAFFPTKMGCKKASNLRRILQKCAKSAFMQYPL